MQVTSALCQRLIDDIPYHEPYKASLLKYAIRESLEEISELSSARDSVLSSQDIIKSIGKFHTELAEENEGKYRDPKNMDALLQEIKSYVEGISPDVDTSS